MRATVRQLFLVAVAAACLLMGFSTSGAVYEVDIDDPNLFGPGEAWEIPPKIEPGDGGPWVRRLQERLAEAGFRPGPFDGRFGKETLGAVYAFQKVHDLERDGAFRVEHWDLLDTELVLPVHDEAPNRVEVDLSRQVLYLIKDQEVEAVVPVSSGNGETYRSARGTAVRARTPEGGYEFYKRYEGWRISYLGGLYRPFYFRGGYAIHGSKSVPPYPASHGCVRVELHDMDYLTTKLELGMPVFVYGRRMTREDLLPRPPEPPPVRQIDPGQPINSSGSPAIA